MKTSDYKVSDCIDIGEFTGGVALLTLLCSIPVLLFWAFMDHLFMSGPVSCLCFLFNFMMLPSFISLFLLCHELQSNNRIEKISTSEVVKFALKCFFWPVTLAFGIWCVVKEVVTPVIDTFNFYKNKLGEYNE